MKWVQKPVPNLTKPWQVVLLIWYFCVNFLIILHYNFCLQEIQFVVPRGANLTYNGDPGVGKLTFENLKMSNFPWRRRRRRTTWRPSAANNRSCGLGLQHISLILDMHIRFNWQLSYYEISWPVSRGHIAGSGLKLIKVTCFLKLSADQVLDFVWIAGSCQVNLWKTWQDCWVNANPGFKINQNITFSPLQKCFAALFCVWWSLKLKTGGQTIHRKPHRKVAKLKSKFYLFLD